MAKLNLERIAKQVEKLMLDTITIKRPVSVAMDAPSMVEVTTYTTIYSGPGFVAPMGDPGETRLGGKDVQRIQYEIGIPRSADQIKPNDVVTVLTSDDGNLVDAGPVFYVHSEIPTTFLSHRRVKAFMDEEATGIG